MLETVRLREHMSIPEKLEAERAIDATAQRIRVLAENHPERTKRAKWAQETAQMEASASGEWDQIMVQKRKKSAATGRIFAVGFFLMAIPVVLLPILWLFPLSPGTLSALTTVQVLCAGAGLVSLMMGAAMSARHFINLGGTSASFKDQLVLSELDAAFESVLYQPALGIDPRVIAATRLIHSGSQCRGNDYISGTYRGIPFQQADIALENHTYQEDAEGNRTYDRTRVFQGRWLILRRPRQVQREFYIYNQSFPTSREVTKDKADKLQSIETEDTTFNNAFTIRTANPHDVFYFLTPPVIDRLKDPAGLHSGNTVLNGVGI